MEKTRVLIVYSARDGQTSPRGNAGDLLDDFELERCYSIDPERRPGRPIPKLSHAADRELLEQIIKEDLADELKEKIRTFSPEFLVIDSEGVFDAATGPFLTVLIALTEQFPKLAVALSHRSAWLVRRTGMDYDPFKRKTAINQIKWVKHNTADHEALSPLVAALFEPKTANP